MSQGRFYADLSKQFITVSEIAFENKFVPLLLCYFENLQLNKKEVFLAKVDASKKGMPILCAVKKLLVLLAPWAGVRKEGLFRIFSQAKVLEKIIIYKFSYKVAGLLLMWEIRF